MQFREVGKARKVSKQRLAMTLKVDLLGGQFSLRFHVKSFVA